MKDKVQIAGEQIDRHIRGVMQTEGLTGGELLAIVCGAFVHYCIVAGVPKEDILATVGMAYDDISEEGREPS